MIFVWQRIQSQAQEKNITREGKKSRKDVTEVVPDGVCLAVRSPPLLIFLSVLFPLSQPLDFLVIISQTPFCWNLSVIFRFIIARGETSRKRRRGLTFCMFWCHRLHSESCTWLNVRKESHLIHSLWFQVKSNILVSPRESDQDSLIDRSFLSLHFLWFSCIILPLILVFAAFACCIPILCPFISFLWFSSHCIEWDSGQKFLWVRSWRWDFSWFNLLASSFFFSCLSFPTDAFMLLQGQKEQHIFLSRQEKEWLTKRRIEWQNKRRKKRKKTERNWLTREKVLCFVFGVFFLPSSPCVSFSFSLLRICLSLHSLSPSSHSD